MSTYLNPKTKMFAIAHKLRAKIKPYRLLQLSTQLVAYAYSAFILLYLILRLIYWDRLWPVAFVGIFIPLILLPIFLLPILSFLIIKKRWFSILSCIACIWLVGWLHLTYWFPHPIQSSVSQPSLKILTLNCSWHKANSEKLFNLVQKRQPDIIFLQELVEEHSQKAFVWLKAAYPYQFVKESAGILSKYPIRTAENFHLGENREFRQRGIIQFDRQDVVIYNIQMTSPWIRPHKFLHFFTIPAYEYGDRAAEMQDLIQRLQKETLPVIAVGDFNMTDQSQDHNYLKTILQDSFQRSGTGFGFTWPNGWPLNFILKSSNFKLNYPIFRLDYIWYSQHWRSQYSQVLPTAGSEHLPVESELILLRG